MLVKNFNVNKTKLKKNNIDINQKLKSLLREKNQIILSLSKNYKNSFKKKNLNKYKNTKHFRVIGMGGSSLGTQTIYDFLKHKIKKNFSFIDNLQSKKKNFFKKRVTNLVVSKSGNTIETLINTNLFIKKNDNNIFITENKKSDIYLIAEKLKAEIIHHNNFIGGRYSVLSEVGMVPAELMGLNSNYFRQLNQLIKKKNFINSLIHNVASTLFFIKNKKLNSVIINYDEKSDSLFKWYQQLIAESLGKKNKGLLPVISTMPRDNHSVMQLYLDGFKTNFFTFFYVNENKSEIIGDKNNILFNKYYKNKKIENIIYAQKKATEIVFSKKKIPFRSFEIKKRDEKSLGELFCFFILETILLGKCLEINPYDQPSVELIKNETKKLI